MENPSLDPKPEHVSRILRTFYSFDSYHCRYLERETEMWLRDRISYSCQYRTRRAKLTFCLELEDQRVR
jgi:hypothetical protein